MARRPHTPTDPPAHSRDALAYEATEVGHQSLTPGVAPITLHDQLALRLAAPASPRRYAGAQKPCDIGLFDTVALSQTDLAREAARADRRPSSPKAKE